jgi:hypothetical protein
LNKKLEEWASPTDENDPENNIVEANIDALMSIRRNNPEEFQKLVSLGNEMQEASDEQKITLIKMYDTTLLGPTEYTSKPRPPPVVEDPSTKPVDPLLIEEEELEKAVEADKAAAETTESGGAPAS